MSEDFDLAEWMPLTRAAQLLDLHCGTIRRWIRERRLEASKRGRYWYVRREDVRAMLREPEWKPAPKPQVPAGQPTTPKWAKDILDRARI